MAFPKSEKKIYISLINTPLSVLDREMLKTISTVFKRKVILQREKLDLEEFFDPMRDQYHSTGILKYYIFNNKIEKYDKKCLIVSKDLFIPILTFVFGEAHVGGNYCIVSTYRLCERFYKKETNEKILKERILKEIIHELGHTFGLTHCIDNLCVMHNSFDIEDTDRKSIYPCESCFQKLDTLL